MTQRDLDRQVAYTTGKTVSTIHSMGFSLIEISEAAPLKIDWDELDEDRVAVLPQRLQRQRAAAA